MKNKKISILIVVLGLILLVIGAVLMFMGTDDKDKLSSDQEINDECKYNLSKEGELVLDFKCDNFNVEGQDLLFKFSKNEEDTYNLNITYNDKNIYSSYDNDVVMYSEKEAGNTSITNINDLYFVHTYATSQCGNLGHLIVVSNIGEVVNSFNGIFEISKEDSVLYVNEMTNQECGEIEAKEGLYDQYNIVGSRLNKVGSVYEFNSDTTVSDGNLDFEYGKLEEENYLNILYNGNNIFSSKDKNITIYSEEYAGYTKISKIDNVYLIETAAAHQCGNKGTLIVTNSNGELLGVFDSLNFKTNKQDKSFTFIKDEKNSCANLEEEVYEEVIYYINGSNISE